MNSTGRHIGLFFGSFNPIHIGHLIIASHILENGGPEEVWFVVSPHNPLKPRHTLARDHDRLHLVQLAVADNPRMRASHIEFGLPKPSYTIDTMAYLKEKYPLYRFSLIMGGDNLATLDKWKNFEVLLRDHDILVYSRPGHGPTPWDAHPRVRFFEAPLLHISATFIREGLRAGRSMRYLLPEPVYQYLETCTMYRD